MEILQNFPIELLKKVCWMNFVTHPRPGGGIDKIPINPNTLYTASACTPRAGGEENGRKAEHGGVCGEDHCRRRICVR